MTMGGMFGFVLDMIFGTDEGFREYLWSAPKGMQYAMGSLITARFGRYIVTILFDMFFTVILFKQLFPKLVLVSGFTVRTAALLSHSVFFPVMCFHPAEHWLPVIRLARRKLALRCEGASGSRMVSFRHSSRCSLSRFMPT